MAGATRLVPILYWLDTRGYYAVSSKVGTQEYNQYFSNQDDAEGFIIRIKRYHPTRGFIVRHWGFSRETEQHGSQELQNGTLPGIQSESAQTSQTPCNGANAGD